MNNDEDRIVRKVLEQLLLYAVGGAGIYFGMKWVSDTFGWLGTFAIVVGVLIYLFWSNTREMKRLQVEEQASIS